MNDAEILVKICELAGAHNENYDFDIDEFEVVEEDDWTQDHKYQYRTNIYRFIEHDVYFGVSESRSGSYHSDWYYGDCDVFLTDKPVEMVSIAKSELARLRECEALLWDVESSLPSGLESWIDDETLETLRG